jgi:hypothetical protein
MCLMGCIMVARTLGFSSWLGLGMGNGKSRYSRSH